VSYVLLEIPCPFNFQASSYLKFLAKGVV